MNNDLQKLIEAICTVQEISINLEKIKKEFTVKSYSKKEYLCRAGEVPEYLYFIISGLVRFLYIDYKGNEHIKGFYAEDSFCASYSGLLYRHPSPYFIEALEETRVYRIHHSDYLRNIETDPVWSFSARKTAEQLYSEKEKKESSLLLENAPERYRRFLVEYSHLIGRIKQKHIASFLNITPESLSRIKKEIAKDQNLP